VVWLAMATLKRHRDTPQLATPAAVLLILLTMQITLGLASYVTRVIWYQQAAAPLISMVAATVAHVACGALVLVTTVILAIQIHRHVATPVFEPWVEPLAVSSRVRTSGDGAARSGRAG
jgi:heme A synthase